MDLGDAPPIWRALLLALRSPERSSINTTVHEVGVDMNIRSKPIYTSCSDPDGETGEETAQQISGQVNFQQTISHFSS